MPTTYLLLAYYTMHLPRAPTMHLPCAQAENSKLKLMLKQLQGDQPGGGGGGGAGVAGDCGEMMVELAPGDGGLPLSEPPPPHTLRQEELAQRISTAVHTVGGVSEADRQKAIAEVARQMEP